MSQARPGLALFPASFDPVTKGHLDLVHRARRVFPELVVYDEEGKPETVQYHLLSALLLGELQRQDERDREQQRELQRQDERVAELTARLEAVETDRQPPAPGDRGRRRRGR